VPSQRTLKVPEGFRTVPVPDGIELDDPIVYTAYAAAGGQVVPSGGVALQFDTEEGHSLFEAVGSDAVRYVGASVLSVLVCSDVYIDTPGGNSRSGGRFRLQRAVGANPFTDVPGTLRGTYNRQSSFGTSGSISRHLRLNPQDRLRVWAFQRNGGSTLTVAPDGFCLTLYGLPPAARIIPVGP